MAKPPTVGEVIAARVRKYRTDRGWSVRQLAEKCAEQGATTLTQASLTNIERGLTANSNRGSRAVTVEELLSLAYVLSVPPMMLIFPFGDSNEVLISPKLGVRTLGASEWFTGAILEPGEFGSIRTIQVPGVEWDKYRSALGVFRSLSELDLALQRLMFTRRLMEASTDKLTELRRAMEMVWETEPERRPIMERTARRNRQPLPGLPISDEEFVAEWRQGLELTYEERLLEYGKAVLRAAEAGVSAAPPVSEEIIRDMEKRGALPGNDQLSDDDRIDDSDPDWPVKMRRAVQRVADALEGGGDGS